MHTFVTLWISAWSIYGKGLDKLIDFSLLTFLLSKFLAFFSNIFCLLSVSSLVTPSNRPIKNLLIIFLTYSSLYVFSCKLKSLGLSGQYETVYCVKQQLLELPRLWIYNRLRMVLEAQRTVCRGEQRQVCFHLCCNQERVSTSKRSIF